MSNKVTKITPSIQPNIGEEKRSDIIFKDPPKQPVKPPSPVKKG